VAPPPSQTRRRLKALAAALPIAVLAPLALASSASAGIFLPESGGSPNADAIRTLYILLAIIGLVIFIAVEGLLVYSMIKFRARKGATAAQIHGNTQLEIGWTVGAAVILVFITVFTFVKLGDIKNPAPSDIDTQGQPVASLSSPGTNLYAATDQPAPPGDSARLNIRVDGQQYVWRYQYPGSEKVYSYVDMYVPVGMTVTLDVTADDVAHSWWIPALGGKADAIPGLVNKTWFKIPLDAIPDGQDRVVFNGQCAELCGRNHANMIGRVIGLRYEDWKAWYANEATEIKQAQEAAAQERARLEADAGQQASSGSGGEQTSQGSQDQAQETP
jgi:cytochrome c oxidase subunit 2